MGTGKMEHVGRCCLCGEPASFLDTVRRGLVCDAHKPRPEPAEFVRASFQGPDGAEVDGEFLPVWDEEQHVAKPAARIPGRVVMEDGTELVADFLPDSVKITEDERPRKRRPKQARPTTGGEMLPGFDS